MLPAGRALQRPSRAAGKGLHIELMRVYIHAESRSQGSVFQVQGFASVADLDKGYFAIGAADGVEPEPPASAK